MLKKKFNLSTNYKISSFKKSIEVDSDKSISIRSFLIGAISQDVSSAKNILESEDVLTTIKCLKNLGVKIKKIKSKNYLIFGKSLGSLFAKKGLNLNFGNSGTLARLLIGILSTTPNIEIKVGGDHSLNKRNMEKLIKLMSKFGASFLPKNKFFFPLKMISSNMPIGITYKAGVSAQLKSAVIFAALNSYGNTKILEYEKSRDHTENMLLKNTRAIKIENKKKKLINIFGKKNLNSFNINVPGDPSSAAFFTALTLLNQNSSLEIKNVGLNSSRTGFYRLLKLHGAQIKFKNLKKQNNELRGDIYVKSSKIKPIKASKDFYVNSTDEYPILFILAALTHGVSEFSGISDLANKESNRIVEMQRVLKQVGIKSIASKNKLKIFGKERVDVNKKVINVPGLGDHRICMSTFVLGILTGVRTKIKNFETVYTSSPSFLKTMSLLGAKFEIQK
jgi:3-phosphoshikimate 1-carboxyvinyltransferase